MSFAFKDNISPELARAAAVVTNRRPILEAMGTQLESLTKRAFNEPQLRPKPWPNKRGDPTFFDATKERTVRGEIVPQGPPSNLRKNQVLVRSIRVTSVTNDSVTVATDRVYAAIHQLGGIIRPKAGKALRFQIGGRTIFAKKVTMPARPFFPFIGDRMTDSARAKIKAVGEAKLKALLRAR